MCMVTYGSHLPAPMHKKKYRTSKKKDHVVIVMINIIRIFSED